MCFFWTSQNKTPVGWHLYFGHASLKAFCHARRKNFLFGGLFCSKNFQSPQLQKNAASGMFCFGRASHKNFRSRKAQKFWSVVIFASFAPVAKTIPSAARCASFEPVKTKLRSADTCTSAASVAKTFSRARHQKKRSVVTSFSLALVRKKIGRWTLLLQSCQSQNAKVVIRARRETLMSAVTRASFTSVAVKHSGAPGAKNFSVGIHFYIVRASH